MRSERVFQNALEPLILSVWGASWNASPAWLPLSISKWDHYLLFAGIGQDRWVMVMDCTIKIMFNHTRKENHWTLKCGLLLPQCHCHCFDLGIVSWSSNAPQKSYWKPETIQKKWMNIQIWGSPAKLPQSLSKCSCYLFFPEKQMGQFVEHASACGVFWQQEMRQLAKQTIGYIERSAFENVSLENAPSATYPRIEQNVPHVGWVMLFQQYVLYICIYLYI